MANASSMDPLVSSGVDPKTEEELGKFVGKTIDKAVEKSEECAMKPEAIWLGLAIFKLKLPTSASK